MDLTEANPPPEDVIITLRPAAGASTIEIDRLSDGSYRATHRAGLGMLEICRTADLERLLRQLNEAMITGSPSAYVAAVRSIHATGLDALDLPKAG